jgi:hypothetical protein
MEMRHLYKGAPGAEPFADVPLGSNFLPYIVHLYDLGYLNGYPCGGAGEPCVPPGDRPYFRPNNPMT